MLSTRRSGRLAEKRLKLENETRMTNISALDNYIMVKVFKYLDYYELAESSRVSKRFCDVIRANRKSLARLTVESIRMSVEPGCGTTTFAVQTFNKKLSPQAFNEWVLRNQYSNQGQIDAQIAGQQKIEYDNKTEYVGFYCLDAEIGYRYPNYDPINFDPKTTVFHARVPLVHSHENLPVNQHFVRLVTDPNIHIKELELAPQNDVLTLLAQAIGNQNHNRLHCEKLGVNIDTQNLISWVKNYVYCSVLHINNCFAPIFYSLCKYDDAIILDLCLNGAHITSAIDTLDYDFSDIVVDLVQKFIDLKKCDQYQFVKSIRSYVATPVLEALKQKYRITCN